TKGMDTMRRYLFCLTAVGLLAVFLGCHHTAGVCDCEPDQSCHRCNGYGHGCGEHGVVPGGTVVAPGTVTTPGAVKPEVIQTPPKEDKEEMKKDKDVPPVEKENKDEPVLLK